MIKFFRKIRKNLLMENKKSKYLKYAIGEIILVVIGILIALQINNNSETKKARIFEQKMLFELKNALQNDIIFFKEHLIGKRMQTEQEASQFFENYFINGTIEKDSVNYYYSRLNKGLQITYNKGPYEALKSTGIDKVKNDSLRNKIIDLYEFKLPRHTGLITHYLEFSGKHITTHSDNIRDQVKIQINQGKVEYKYARMKNIDIKTNQDFIKLLSWSSTRSKRTIEMFGSILPLMENLVIQIDKELYKND